MAMNFGPDFFTGILAGAVATGIISLIVSLIIRKVLLGDTVLNYLADHTDDIIDNLEKKDPEVGKALRERLVAFCDDLKAALLAVDKK